MKKSSSLPLLNSTPTTSASSTVKNANQPDPLLVSSNITTTENNNLKTSSDNCGIQAQKSPKIVTRTSSLSKNSEFSSNCFKPNHPLGTKQIVDTGKDPFRMIKITEIIEINNNSDTAYFNESNSLNCSKSSNLNSFPENPTTKTQGLNNNKSNGDTLGTKFFESKFDTISSQDDSSSLNFMSTSIISNCSQKQPHYRQYHAQQPESTMLSNPQRLGLGSRQLPILVEKMNQTCFEDYETQNDNEDTMGLSKPAEIVLEIINVGSDGEQQSEANDECRKFNVESSGQNNSSSQKIKNKPKKITIRITGKTRSFSSDKGVKMGQQQIDQQSLIKPKTAFLPLTPFKPTVNGLKNSASLETKNCDFFRPIQQQVCNNDNDDTEYPSNDSFQHSNNCTENKNFNNLASEENSSISNISEAKFDLVKFKSFLNAFNQSNSNITNNSTSTRSSSMPPKTINSLSLNRINRKQSFKNNYRELSETSNLNPSNQLNKIPDDDFYGLQPINEYNTYIPNQKLLNGSKRRTAFNSRKNMSFLEDNSMRSRDGVCSSDTDEPIWAYRDANKTPTKKATLQKQNSVNLGASSNKGFGCGLFNKASKLSVKVDDEEEMEEEAENDFRNNSEQCKTKSNIFQLPKSPKCDTRSLIKVDTPSSIRSQLGNRFQGDKSTLNLQFSGRKFENQNKKKVSSYYNDFYSNQNRFNSDLSDPRYIDDDTTTGNSSNLEDDSDANGNRYGDQLCDCNEDNSGISDDDTTNNINEDDTDADQDLDGCGDLNDRTNVELKSKQLLKNGNNLTTFLPVKEDLKINQNSLNSPKTPKLVRKVLFADQI